MIKLTATALAVLVLFALIPSFDRPDNPPSAPAPLTIPTGQGGSDCNVSH